MYKKFPYLKEGDFAWIYWNDSDYPSIYNNHKFIKLQIVGLDHSKSYNLKEVPFLTSDIYNTKFISKIIHIHYLRSFNSIWLIPDDPIKRKKKKLLMVLYGFDEHLIETFDIFERHLEQGLIGD